MVTAGNGMVTGKLPFYTFYYPQLPIWQEVCNSL